MKNRFDDLPYLIGNDDARRLDDIFSAFEADSFISADSAERILSSVMERADFSMNKTKKSPRRILKKHFVIFIAAAVILLTAAVSAAAVGIRKSREENLRESLGETAVSFLEEQGLTESKEAENPHFKIYIDTLLSDGNYCQMVIAYEALDDAAMNQMKQQNEAFFPYTTLCYSDTKEEISMAGAGQCTDLSRNDDSHMYIVMNIPLFEIDISRPVTMHFNTYGILWDYDNEENYANGIELELDLSPNLETKLLTDDRGRTLLLSPIGMSCCAPIDEWSDFEPSEVLQKIFLLKKDGSEYHMPKRSGVERCDENNPELPNYGMTYIRIHNFELLDIESIIGVRISDITFLEQTDK